MASKFIVHSIQSVHSSKQRNTRQQKKTEYILAFLLNLTETAKTKKSFCELSSLEFCSSIEYIYSLSQIDLLRQQKEKYFFLWKIPFCFATKHAIQFYYNYELWFHSIKNDVGAEHNSDDHDSGYHKIKRHLGKLIMISLWRIRMNVRKPSILPHLFANELFREIALFSISDTI